MLISLIGEQPIPVLLVDRALKPTRHLLAHSEKTCRVAENLKQLLPHAQPLLLHDPYDLDGIRAAFERVYQPGMTFNLTGGTKPMMLATYELARQHQAPFVYLESERHQSRLYEYAFAQETPQLTRETIIPTLLDIKTYLNAYLPGFSTEPYTANSGAMFEQAVAQSLQKRGFEIATNVRPNGVGEKIEIDLVIRAGNQVGIAEVKLGDSRDEAPKKAVDQLNTAGEQKYLGTYTAKFLITARKPRSGIMALAHAHRITVIVLNYRDGAPSLTLPEANKLGDAVRDVLGQPQKKL